MRKFTILLLFAFFTINLIAQENSALQYAGVINVDSVGAIELRSRCINWFAVAFNNSDKVLRTSSEDQLIAKPVIAYIPSMLSDSEPIKGLINYTLTIQFKENKFRYTLSDFFHEGNPHATLGPVNFGLLTTDTECPVKTKMLTTQKWRNKVWIDMKDQVDKSVLPLIENLKTALQKKQTKQDAW